MAASCVVGDGRGRCPEDVPVGQVEALGEGISGQRVSGSETHLWKHQDLWLTPEGMDFFSTPGFV